MAEKGPKKLNPPGWIVAGGGGLRDNSQRGDGAREKVELGGGSRGRDGPGRR
jgi:hypothetical protein